MAQDFKFNFTNITPLNSGWSTSSLAAKLKTAQDATAAKAAADAAQASVYGHVNAGNKGGGGGSGSNPALAILGTAIGGPVGGVLGSAAGGLLGGSDGRTPAQKLDHQTKMLAKAEDKALKEKNKLANEQQNVEALQAAIAKATDPAVIENLNKELEKAQKAAGKVQKKFDSFGAQTAEIKQKITGLDAKVNPGGSTAAPAAITTANYYNDLVDKALATRPGVSGWHSVATGGTPLLNPADVKPAANNPANAPTAPVTGTPAAVNQNLVVNPALPVYNPNTFGLNKKQLKKSGWGSSVMI